MPVPGSRSVVLPVGIALLPHGVMLRGFGVRGSVHICVDVCSPPAAAACMAGTAELLVCMHHNVSAQKEFVFLCLPCQVLTMRLVLG